MYICLSHCILLKEGVIDVGQRRFARFLVERGTCVDKVIDKRARNRPHRDT